MIISVHCNYYYYCPYKVYNLEYKNGIQSDETVAYLKQRNVDRLEAYIEN